MRRVRPFEPGTYWSWVKFIPSGMIAEYWDTMAHLVPLPVDPMGERSALCGRLYVRFSVAMGLNESGERVYTTPTEPYLCRACCEIWRQYVYDGTVTREHLPKGGDE